MTTITHLESVLRQFGGRYREFHCRESQRVLQMDGECFIPDIPSIVAVYEKRPFVPCCLPFDSLQRTSLKLLKLNEVAKGKFLLLRTLERAYSQLNCVFNVVEDHLGFITFLHLYNYIIESSEVEEYFPIGTMIIIKEPYFEMNKKSLAIRVDCATDVIVLRSHHELYRVGLAIPWINTIDTSGNPLFAEPKPQNGEDWKTRGNNMYLAGKYYLAVEGYSLCLKEAIKSGDAELKKLTFTNLAAAYLKLGEFESAIESSEKALAEFPEDKKALHRAGRACYELGDYHKAKIYFERFEAVDPNDVIGRKELSRVCQRIHEQETGTYDIGEMYEHEVKKCKGPIDVADYVGPVKFVEFGDKRRGVVATDDIDADTLVAVSKAFKARTRRNFDDCFSISCSKIYTDMSVAIGNSSIDLATAVFIAIYKNPNTLGPLIDDLCLTSQQPRFCHPEKRSEPIVNFLEIIKLIYSKAFRIDDFETGNDLLMMSDHSGSGLFLFPSHMRHSCLPNCCYVIINNVMLIRTLWPIKKGEEITISLVNSLKINSQARLEIIKTRGHNCECLLCELDQMESANWRQKRCERVAKFMESYSLHLMRPHTVGDAIFEKMEKLIADIDYTYSRTKRQHLKTELFLPLIILGKAYASTDRLVKMREVVMRAIRDLGFGISDLKKFVDGDLPVSLRGKAFLTVELFQVLEMLTHNHVVTSKQDSKELAIISKAGVKLRKLVLGIRSNEKETKLKISHTMFLCKNSSELHAA